MTATWHHMRKLAMPLVPNHCGLGNQQGAVRMVALVLTGPKNQKLQRKGRLCQSDKGMGTAHTCQLPDSVRMHLLRYSRWWAIQARGCPTLLAGWNSSALGLGAGP